MLTHRQIAIPILLLLLFATASVAADNDRADEIQQAIEDYIQGMQKVQSQLREQSQLKQPQIKKPHSTVHRNITTTDSSDLLTHKSKPPVTAAEHLSDHTPQTNLPTTQSADSINQPEVPDEVPNKNKTVQPVASTTPAVNNENHFEPDEQHNSDELDEIIVTAKQDSLDSSLSSIELNEADLQKVIASTLGGTLNNELGISNASFGPGVGLPVLRGLSGARVRVLQDGIASWDASSVSPDHASSVEAVSAKKIKIVKGPATIRYGGSAVGGVVDVIDNRIPSVDEIGTWGAVDHRHGNNGDQHTTHVEVDAATAVYGIHLDGFSRGQNNLEIPGEAIDSDAVFDQFGLNIVAESEGVIDNTSADANGYNFGASYLQDKSMIGFAVGKLVNDYGIPIGGHTEVGDTHAHGEGEDSGAVRLDLEQTRYDMKAETHVNEQIESIVLRLGHVDYQHVEYEQGFTGTEFTNKVTEARIEVNHSVFGELHGTLGVQWWDREFAAIGAEAFIPQSDISALGVYLIENASWWGWDAHFGFRADIQKTDPGVAARSNGVLVQTSSMEHQTYQTSVGVQRTFGQYYRLSINAARAQRAPDVHELLSLGPHLSTRTFDIGNSKLTNEVFEHIELALSRTSDSREIDLSVFYEQVDEFIYQHNTGTFFSARDSQIRSQCVQIDQCFPVMEYRQQGATFFGHEFKVLQTIGDSFWRVGLFTDSVRAQFTAGGDVPRVPPFRFGLQLEYDSAVWVANLRVMQAAKQDHPGENELETDGYLLVNGHVAVNIASTDNTLWKVYLRGNNLLDEEIRNATSFLRFFSPEPGRSLELGINFQF